jgi:hypothetical protein
MGYIHVLTKDVGEESLRGRLFDFGEEDDKKLINIKNFFSCVAHFLVLISFSSSLLLSLSRSSPLALPYLNPLPCHLIHSSPLRQKS